MPTSKGYSAGRVFLQVVPSYDGFMKQLRKDMPALTKAFEGELQKSFDNAGKDAGRTLGESLSKAVNDNVDIDDAWTKSLKKSLAAAEEQIGTSSEGMRANIRGLRDELEAGGVDSQLFQRKVDALGEALRRLSNEPGLDPQLKKTFGDAARSMLGAAEAAKRTREEVARVKEEAKAAERAERDRANALRKGAQDSNVAAKALSRLQRALTGAKADSQDGANAFRFFNFAILAVAALGPSVIPVLAAIGGGIAALGPIALGVGAGLGVFALGLSGISDAVKALDKDQQATKAGSAGYARAVQNAARQVADARRSLKDAYRNSAEGVESALENQRDAERRLADAMKDSRDAQRDLTAARKEARQELADLNAQIAQNGLDERQGVIDLFNASNEYGAVMADGGSTNLEREQASIALEQARLNLVKIRTEQKRLADEKKKGDKTGVDGTDKVRNAQDRVTEAIEREKEARRDLGKAAKEIDKARADGARGVADAQRALTRAQEDYNYALQGGAENVDQLAEAMGKLSPAGQRFARFIQSLKSGFREIRDIAQTNMLPGLEEGMRNVMEKYGPGFKVFIGDMSSLLGDLSIKAGEAFTNDNFARFFKTMSDASLQFTSDAGEGVLGFLEGLAGFFTAATPTALALSGYIRDIGVNFGTWANGEEGQARLGEFFAYVDRVGPKVKNFFISLASALGNVAVALAPIGESILSYLTDFFEFIAGVDPDILRPILVGLGALIVALQVISGVVAVLSVVIPILTSPLLLIVGSIVALGAAFFFLSRSNTETGESFRRFLKKLEPLGVIFKDIVGLVRDRLVKTFKEDLLPALKELGAFFTEEFIPALEKFYPTIRPIVKFLINVFGVVLAGVIQGVKNLILGILKVIMGIFKVISGVIAIFQGDFKKGFGLMWDGVKLIFLGAIQAIIGFFTVTLLGGVRSIIGKLFGGFKGLFTTRLPGLFKKLGPNLKSLFTKPFREARDVLTRIGTRVASVFEKMAKALKGTFKRVRGFVVDTKNAIVNLGKKAGTVAGDIGSFFKKKMGNGIRTVVDLIVNKALIGGVNRIGGWLGLGGKDKQLIKPVNLDKPFHAGGYTGPGSKYTPAGIVHADEFVIRKESRQRIEAAKPGFLDALNRDPGTAGFADGGRVWPGASRRIYPNYGGHTGVDFSWGPGGVIGAGGFPFKAASSGTIESAGYGRGFGQAVFARGMDGLLQIYGHAASLAVKAGQKVTAGQRLGIIGSTGNSSGPHLHFEIAPGDSIKSSNRAATLAWLRGAKDIKGGGKAAPEKSPAEKLFGKVGKVGKSAILRPASFLKNRVKDGFAKVKGVGGDMLAMLKEVPGALIGDIVTKVKKFATGKLGDIYQGAKDRITQSPAEQLQEKLRKKIAEEERKKRGPGHGGRDGATLYDQGGWLPPGHTSVYNATGRPEPVFNPEQWDKIKDGKVGGGDTYNLEAHGADPDALATKLFNDIARQRRLARRSGTLGRSGGR